MVFIHGGGFWEGGGASFNGTELARRGVVLVTINYRLDILGFLSTEDDASPGNYGLLDAIQALKWIKANIARFRGNPDDVTIFGESAGSVISSHLRISPLARGVFRKVIMESGFSVCKWAVILPTDTPSPLTSAQTVGAKLGCPTNKGSAALVSCIKSQPVDSLLNASASIRTEYASVFLPVVESGFGVLPKAPEQLILEGAGSEILSIRGSNRDEDIIGFIMAPNPTLDLPGAESAALQQASVYFPGSPQQAAAALLQEYVLRVNHTTSMQLIHSVGQLITDLRFNYPMLKESRLATSIPGSARQFVFQFSYQSPNSLFPLWAGVPHTAELPFVFGEPFDGKRNWTETDKRVSSDMMDMWVNFAKYGDPTPLDRSSIVWLPYTQTTQAYLKIEDQPSLTSHLNRQRMELLEHLFGLYGA